MFSDGRLNPLQPSHLNQSLISIRIMLLNPHVKLLRCSQPKCGQHLELCLLQEAHADQSFAPIRCR